MVIRMNKNGFTLIELVLTVTIIALLTLIISPNVFSMINKSKLDSCNELIDNIELAAINYASTNKYDLNLKNNTVSISVAYLYDHGYISGTYKGELSDGLDERYFSNPNIENDKFNFTDNVNISFNESTLEFTAVYNKNCDNS